MIRGASISIRDNGGLTALDWACRSGHTRIASMLLERHPSLISSVSDTGETSLHRAAQYAAEFDKGETLIKLLLKKGANPAARDNEGRVPHELYFSRRAEVRRPEDSGFEKIARLLDTQQQQQLEEDSDSDEYPNGTSVTSVVAIAAAVNQALKRRRTS